MERLIRTKSDYYQLKNKPSQLELNDYYANKYYQQSLSSYKTEYSQEELELIEARNLQREYLINEILSVSQNRDRSMLDVGCGEGFALQTFYNKGWKVKGLDFSIEGIKKQNPSMVKHFMEGDIYALLDNEILLGNKYEVIWIQNVLEHVLEPEKLLLDIKKLTTPRGVVVITVPNDFSELQKFLLNEKKVSKPYWIAVPDHISYFDIHSIKNMVKDTGWECKKIIADFPIDWFLFNERSNYIENLMVGKDAYKAKLQIVNLINKNNVVEINNFYESLAAIGMGRNLTAFISCNFN